MGMSYDLDRYMGRVSELNEECRRLRELLRQAAGLCDYLDSHGSTIGRQLAEELSARIRDELKGDTE